MYSFWSMVQNINIKKLVNSSHFLLKSEERYQKTLPSFIFIVRFFFIVTYLITFSILCFIYGSLNDYAVLDELICLSNTNLYISDWKFIKPLEIFFIFNIIIIYNWTYFIFLDCFIYGSLIILMRNFSIFLKTKNNLFTSSWAIVSPFKIFPSNQESLNSPKYKILKYLFLIDLVLIVLFILFFYILPFLFPGKFNINGFNFITKVISAVSTAILRVFINKINIQQILSSLNEEGSWFTTFSDFFRSHPYLCGFILTGVLTLVTVGLYFIFKSSPADHPILASSSSDRVTQEEPLGGGIFGINLDRILPNTPSSPPSPAITNEFLEQKLILLKSIKKKTPSEAIQVSSNRTSSYSSEVPSSSGQVSSPIFDKEEKISISERIARTFEKLKLKGIVSRHLIDIDMDSDDSTQNSALDPLESLHNSSKSSGLSDLKQ